MSDTNTLDTNTFRITLQRPDFSLDVDLQLPAQGITMLFGASGSGKTTLLRLIAGLLPVDAGRIVFGGKDATRFTRRPSKP